MEERRKVVDESECRTSLVRIETKLDNALSWLSKRDKECNVLAETLNLIRVEQGKQGVIVWLFSGVISAIIAGITSYFLI